MAFIGNTNTTQAFTPAVDYFSGNGSTTAFTLSRPVASVAQVQVTIDNVAQNPSSAFTVSANTITFTSAPLSGTNNIYVYYTSPITQVIAPGQGTVTTTSLTSGLTLTSPTITGGAFNGTLGATTPSTVAATSITASTTLNVTGATTLTADATISGLTVGKGGGAVGTNTAIGQAALSGVNTNTYSVAVGYTALQNNTSGGQNTAVGGQTLAANTTGSTNTAVGFQALQINTASGNTAVGGYALNVNTSGASNIAIGQQALGNNTTANNNVAIGFQSCISGTNAASNVAVGYQTLYSVSSGYFNTNIGFQAGSGITTGANNLCLGQGAGNTASPSGNLTTQNDRICVGDNNISNAYIRVSWTVTSDARDKTDIVDSRYGLNFVNSLRPVEYKWDMRSKYEEGQTPDGTHKESKTNLGFLAQEVIEVEKANGAVAGDLLIADDEMDGLLRITETKMIPVLVKAIQELAAKNDALTARIVALENR